MIGVVLSNGGRFGGVIGEMGFEKCGKSSPNVDF